jgi:hypothetical protein
LARYLAALLIGSGGPGLVDRPVSRVALDQLDVGEPLNDIIVDAVAPDDRVARLSLQVKRELVISEAKTNKDFRSFIRDSCLAGRRAGAAAADRDLPASQH